MLAYNLMTEALPETDTIAELEEPCWSVVSFDKCEGGNLTYSDATRLLSDLNAKGVPGLCIVTDPTAARLAF